MRCVVTLLVLAAMATGARAQTVMERAKRLFDEGRALEDRGEPGACERFEESYRLVAAAGTGFNVAECMERAGQLVRALAIFERIAKDYDRDGKASRAKIARQRAASIRPRLGEIVIELAEPALAQLVLVVGGERITPAARLRRPANPGALEITAAAPGRRAFARTVRIESGRSSVVTVALPRVEPVATRETRRRRSRVLAAGGLGVLGAGAMVTGAILFAGARDLDARGEHDAAVRRADLATAFGVGGLALVTAGAIVFATAPREPVVAPVVGPGGAGVTVVGHF